MNVWFEHFSGLFVREDEAMANVRAILTGAVERSASVGFGGLGEEGIPSLADGTIEAVDRTSVSILTPRSGGRRYIAGERLLMCIDRMPGFDIGEVDVLGMWESAGPHGLRSGVRVTIPPMLEHIQRRTHLRLPVAFDLSPRATLATLDFGTPLGAGQVLDISSCGARLAVRLRPEVELKIGMRASLDVNFPSMLPSFCTECEIVHLGRTYDDGRATFGVCFEERMDLVKGIHMLERKRAQRARR